MIELFSGGAYLINGSELVADTPPEFRSLI